MLTYPSRAPSQDTARKVRGVPTIKSLSSQAHRLVRRKIALAGVFSLGTLVVCSLTLTCLTLLQSSNFQKNNALIC